MTNAAPDYQQKPITLLKDASIEAISLVDKGANGHSFFLFKRAANFVDPDGHMHFEHPASEAVVKQAPFIVADEETGKDGKKKMWKAVYCVVAVPGEVDIQKDVWDEHGIEDAAHNFLRKNSAIINYMHRDLEKVGDLVQSAIAPADFKVGDQVIKKGSWYIAIEPNPQLRKQIEAGEITGVSVQGSSKRIAVDPNAEFDTSGPRPVMKGDLVVPEKFGNGGQPEGEAPAKDYDSFDYHHVPMGAEGPGIKKLQKLLNMPATGVYDEDTEDAFVAYLEEKHPEAEPEPTLENLKAVLARAKNEGEHGEEPVAVETPHAPVAPEVEKDADMVDHGEVKGFDPGQGITGDESTTPKIGPMIGNLGVSMKLTTESSSEDLKVALYQAYKQGDADLIQYAKTRYGINSAEHLLGKDLDHEALWFMYSRLVRNADPVEDLEAGQVDRGDAVKPEQEVEKATPVTTQPSFTPRESLDEDAGERLSKSVFTGEDDCADCVELGKACAKHEITKASGWMPEGVTEADLNNSDYAWLSNKFKLGGESASEGRKLPYKVHGKVNPKGWKAAWSMSAKADLEGGPDLQAVRQKLLRDIPKGVKVDRKLLKGAMFDIDSHGLAMFVDKNGMEVYAGTVVKLPGGNVAEVSSVEDESGANVAEIVKVNTVRVDKDGSEVVEQWKPKQLEAVVTTVRSEISKSSAGGSMGGHDPRAHGKIKFIVRSFGQWAGGKQSICVQRMKAEHPEVFKGNEDAGCAWLKDQWLGRTDWRGKDKHLAKGDGVFANYLNADLLLKNIDKDGIMSSEVVDTAFSAICRDLGFDTNDVHEALAKDANGYLATTFGDDMTDTAKTDDLNETEQSMLQKFAAFLKGERLQKSVEAPEKPKVTAGDLDSVLNALKLGIADALEGGEGEERAQDLQAVVSDFGRYVTDHLAAADFVEGEAPEAEANAEAPVAADNDVEKTGDVIVEAEPAALEPRKKKTLTSDSNMEENMEKSTDLTASRERLVAEAGTFASEHVEAAATAEVEAVEKEAPVEGEEAHTLTLDEVALFADKLADGLDELRSQFGGIEKSLGSKLDSLGSLAKSLDLSDRIAAIEESVAELKGTAVEAVEEVAKRVVELEAQPGHSTQAGEVREEVAKAAPAPVLFAGKF